MDVLSAMLYDHLTVAFGAEPTLESQLGKLEEELAEFLVDLDLLELADMVVVCCTMARVCGYSVEDLMAEVLLKMRRNAEREWGPGNGTVARHTREA